MSGSNMELDRCSQQGSLESSASTSSLRGLSSGSFATASTDSLATDTGKTQHPLCRGLFSSHAKSAKVMWNREKKKLA